MKQRWTANMVLARIVEAYEVQADTEGRVGPKAMASAWPEYRSDFLSIKEEIDKLNEGNYVQGRNRVRIQRTSRQISQMERILIGVKQQDKTWTQPWVYRLRGYRDFHRAVMCHAMWKMHGISIAKGCKSRRISVRTFADHRKKGTEIIAKVLNDQGVEVF